MLYTALEVQRTWMAKAGSLMSLTADMMGHPANPFAHAKPVKAMRGLFDTIGHASAHYGKPRFGFTETEVDGVTVRVREEVVDAKPFGSLVRFVREGVEDAPKLLIVAPMSGHFATLLRGTVARLLHKHDVYITDWADARDVPVSKGRFGLDEYIDYVMDWLRLIGPNTHMLAVCQPSVPALAATALMGAAKDPCRPKSLTMMGGPIDTREGQTEVNRMSHQRPLAWFKQFAIHSVPANYKGAGRKVYPGFMQLSAFMSMNLANHVHQHFTLARAIYHDHHDGEHTIKNFYAEYRAVCDMTAEFYIETVDKVFQRHLLPKGELTHRGTPVDLGAITDTAILAVEGGRDDISGVGQTKAALTGTPNLPESHKRYFLCELAGHYGIFNGTRWNHDVAPVVEAFIEQFETA